MNNDNISLKVIAKIYTNFYEKFGIPRQSGLVDTEAIIVFEPQYRNPNAIRGLEDFNYLWLLWEFSKAKKENWSPTVRPPRLGGNKRLGVFATRSPYRPNPIGLSSVKLLRVEYSANKGPIIFVSGADILNGTPIYDIKPYLKYADCHNDANNGFTYSELGKLSKVEVLSNVSTLNKEDISIIKKLLLEDPRPSYQCDDSRIYSMCYKNYEVKFSVKDDTAIISDIILK